ncbi:MAG: hypothetical protein GC185_10695 [Alphaproteobacteria bacterium]|nr:hypothetical protein [Alphaproteobacteria bacterium]
MTKGYRPQYPPGMRIAPAVMVQEDIDDFFKRIAEGRHDSAAKTLDTFGWLLEHKDKSRQATPLIIAAREGRLETVKFLKDRGADIEAVDGAGMTALMNACEKGEVTVATWLAENGARAGRVNAAGLSAATCANAGDFPSLGEKMKEYAMKEVEGMRNAWKAAAGKMSDGASEDVKLMKKITLRGKNPPAP